MEIEEGTVDAPERIAILGESGVGKSSCASHAPRPFFLDVERGSRRLPGIARNKNQITTWSELMSAIAWLETQPHPYLTAVLDTLDRAEWLCTQHLLEKYRVNSLDEIGGGYGKGSAALYEEFRRLFAALERLGEKRAMHVIIVAHQKSETVKNNNGPDYHRYSFKVDNKVGALMYEACDHVLFAKRNVVSVVNKSANGDTRARASGGRDRVMHTMAGPAHIAKTRVRMPDPIPLSWHEFVTYLARGGFPRILRETTRDNARRLGDAIKLRAVEKMLADNDPIEHVVAINAKLVLSLAALAPSAAAEATEAATAAAAEKAEQAEKAAEAATTS